MSNNGTPIDVVQFDLNRRRIPWEHLAPFAGQHVAFNRDGTQVVAHGPDYETVFSQLEKLGISVSEVGFDFIPPLDEDCWLSDCAGLFSSATEECNSFSEDEL